MVPDWMFKPPIEYPGSRASSAQPFVRECCNLNSYAEIREEDVSKTHIE